MKDPPQRFVSVVVVLGLMLVSMALAMQAGFEVIDHIVLASVLTSQDIEVEARPETLHRVSHTQFTLGSAEHTR